MLMSSPGEGEACVKARKPSLFVVLRHHLAVVPMQTLVIWFHANVRLHLSGILDDQGRLGICGTVGAIDL